MISVAIAIDCGSHEEPRFGKALKGADRVPVWVRETLFKQEKELYAPHWIMSRFSGPYIVQG